MLAVTTGAIKAQQLQYRHALDEKAQFFLQIDLYRACRCWERDQIVGPLEHHSTTGPVAGAGRNQPAERAACRLTQQVEQPAPCFRSSSSSAALPKGRPGKRERAASLCALLLHQRSDISRAGKLSANA